MEPIGLSRVNAGSKSFLSRVFTFENLTGDVRSAVIGSITGSIIATITTIVTAAFLVNPPLQYSVFVNDDGFGQPKGLFDLAERHDPKLILTFRPAELRSVYVCEYKLVNGESWKKLVLTYLDAYRDCFDVNARSDEDYIISPNMRTSVLAKKQTTYLCKCGS
jgi:hypothetical protein